MNCVCWNGVFFFFFCFFFSFGTDFLGGIWFPAPQSKWCGVVSSSSKNRNESNPRKCAFILIAFHICRIVCLQHSVAGFCLQICLWVTSQGGFTNQHTMSYWQLRLWFRSYNQQDKWLLIWKQQWLFPERLAQMLTSWEVSPLRHSISLEGFSLLKEEQGMTENFF